MGSLGHSFIKTVWPLFCSSVDLPVTFHSPADCSYFFLVIIVCYTSQLPFGFLRQCKFCNIFHIRFRKNYLMESYSFISQCTNVIFSDFIYNTEFYQLG